MCSKLTAFHVRLQQMRAFWVPSQTPEARAAAEKPDSNTYCPASGKRLRLKDLSPVRFTRVPEGDTGLYMDPITKDTFTNADTLVLLKPTGESALQLNLVHCTEMFACPLMLIRVLHTTVIKFA